MAVNTLLEGVDRRTVLVAGAVAFAFGLLANVSWAVADKIVEFGPDTNWVFAFAPIAWIGSGIAGVIAGRAQPHQPLTHAALAALAGHVLNAVINVVAEAVWGDDDISQLIVILTLLATIPMATAVLAAYVTARVHRR
jgi:hypothetical protein